MTSEKSPEQHEPGSFVPFYGVGARIHMSLKVSKDGESRKEDVEVLRGMYDEDKPKNFGWRVLKRIYGEGDDGGEDLSKD